MMRPGLLRLSATFVVFFVAPLAMLAQAGPDLSSLAVYRCLRVVDGDTIVLKMPHGTQSCRLIGVDTPETVHPNKVVERFGKEASAFLKKLIEGRDVRIANDGPVPTYDEYRRLLVYVFLEGKPTTFVNREIVAKGYGHAYVQYPFEHMEDFRAAERKARDGKLGLWASVIDPIVKATPPTKPTPKSTGDATPKTAAESVAYPSLPSTTATRTAVRKKRTYRQSPLPAGSSGFGGFGGLDGMGSSGGGTRNASLCGAPTQSGAPCQRLVAGGGFCYQHR